MSKKLSAFFVVMLCLTAVIPMMSMSTGTAYVQNSPAESSAELKVNAWTENKIAKSGDLIEVYATTSYNDGVSVSAKIVKYSFETYGTTTIPLPTIIGTTSLSYDNVETCWEGTYQIPGDLHGLYGIEVTATDGTKSAKDSPVEEMMDFYLEHLSPVLQNWETFQQNQLEPTVDYINQSIHNLSTTIEAHGGLKGIVENITSLPQWGLFLEAGYQNSTTMQAAQFLDALTKFIVSPEYDQLISLEPELKSLFEDIFQLMLTWKPLQIIDYLAEFNFTTFLDKIAGSENIISAYQALISSSDYTNFLNALDALKAALTEENFENVGSALQQLGESNYLQELLNATMQYLQGNQTLLQQLIQSLNVSEDTDLGAQLVNLGNLSAFWDLTHVVTEDPNLGVVCNCINTTFYNINTTIHQMANSTEFQALNQSIQSLSEYMSSDEVRMDGPAGSSYGIRYFEKNFAVKDWMEELKMEIEVYLWSGYEGELGQVDVTLTDPNGVEYLYTYNESVWDQRVICYPAHGNWEINITTFGNGSFHLKIVSKQNFPSYMLLGIINELFFVLNAGIAIETESFAQIGTNATAKLIAYDVDGKLPNTPINVSVVRSPFESLFAATVLYTWVSGMGMGPSEGVQEVPMMSGGCSYYDGNYTVTIAYISQPTNPADVYWQVLDPTHTIGHSGTVSMEGFTSEDVTVTWFDNDEDGMLSTNDCFKIYASETSIEGYEFSIIFIVSGNIMGSITLCGGSKVTHKSAYEDGNQGTMEMLPSEMMGILQTLDMLKIETVYEGTVTTEANGEVTITFPVEDYGSYSIYAYLETDTKLGFGTANLFGEQDIPEIALQKLGEFSGIPVYKSPSQVGEDITLNVQVPQDAQLVAFVAPLPLKERYPEINVTYEPSYNFTSTTGNLGLQVNGPVSIIGLVSGNLSAVQPEPAMRGVSSVSQLPAIPQINVSYGILLASDVDVTLTIPTLVKGGTSTICLSAQGTIGNTSGLAFYSNGTDFIALDLSLFSKLFYRYNILAKEPSSSTEQQELLSEVTGVVWGSGTTASAKLPTLCAYGDYSIITVSAVGSLFGVGFAQASFYKNFTVASPISTIQTVAGNTLHMDYVCTAPITATAIVPLNLPSGASQKVPAGKKIVGMGLELNTAGSFYEAFITINYTDADIAGLDENSLRMYYWNETTNEWTLIPDSGVWTNNNTIWARVTHLTIFAPMAEEVAAAPLLLGPMIYTGVIAAIIAVLIVSVAVAARKRKK